MKLTITIEEEKQSEVRVEHVGAGEKAAVEEHAAEVGVMNAGGPPEWLVAELQENRPVSVQEAASGEMLDAGPAPASTDGLATLRR